MFTAGSHFAVKNAGQCADCGCKYSGAYDGGGINTSIFAPVGDYVDGDELQGRNIEN